VSEVAALKDRDKRLERLERAAAERPVKRTLEEVYKEFSAEELEAIIVLDGNDPTEFDEELNQLSIEELEAIAFDGNTEAAEDEMIEWLYAGRARLKQNAL
jgi:thymidylate kinase